MASNTNITTTSYMIPNFVQDFLDRRSLVPGGAKVDATQFLAETGTRVTLTAGAAAAATSISVAALANSIPAGTLLRFAAGQYAYTSAIAAKGATSIAVEALPAALTNGGTAIYAGTGRVFIPAGFALGRTRAERDAGTGFGPAVGTDEEVYLVAFDVTNAAENNDVELLRRGTMIKENKLPDGGIAALAAGVQTLIRNTYECIRGTD